ncbi:hypothetical protein M422DRAFT_165770 [Sphaerobolus stellatus SS14]|uniref:Uncharacterized protein n=1 Tax=Sphaerobolus stellatus (strain SS14) TaxID=990650 RepID=A0A0C9W2X0_SPHS4|nr:hypothetical protein M422DRAFT_165770 [Sphaerobolus stellatus SS14]
MIFQRLGVFPNTDSRRVHPTLNPKGRLQADTVPPSWKPFVQLSRINMPSGAFLTFWPCAWGLLASAYRAEIPLLTTLYQLPAFFVGSVVLRSIACSWNYVCDKDFDVQVKRTEHRPLAAGRVSVKATLIFTIVQAATFVAIPVYPLFKRIMYWPQVWLRCYSTFLGKLLVTSFFYVDKQSVLKSLISWTIYYDTIYATIDVKDDLRIGLKSTAVLFGSWIRPILRLLCIGFIALLIATGILNEQSFGYYGISVLPTTLLLFWEIMTWDQSNPQSAFIRFDQNGRYVGIIVACGLAIDYVLKLQT